VRSNPWVSQTKRRKGELKMGDVYHEHLIKQKMTMNKIWLRVLSVLFCFVPVIFAGFLGAFFLIVEVIVIYLAYFTFIRTDVEVEYSYLTGECQFDKIFSKKSRKNYGKLIVSDMEIMALEGADELKEYENKSYRLRDFSSMDKDAKRFVAFVKKDSELVKIIFEPSEDIVKAIQMQAPRKVIYK
jgi:hypothetical protein